MKICRIIADCRRLPLFSAGLLLAVGLATGCGTAAPHSGKPKADVTITVTHDGQPVSEGRVDLSNEQTGEGGGGELNAKGVVTIPGVALGSYTMVVSPPEALLVPGASQPAPAKKDYANIPAKFRALQTSPLKVDVKQGSPNQFQFELK